MGRRFEGTETDIIGDTPCRPRAGAEVQQLARHRADGRRRNKAENFCRYFKRRRKH